MINISGSIQQGFMSTGFYVKQGFMSTGFYVLHLGHKTKISFPQIQSGVISCPYDVYKGGMSCL